LPLLCAAATDLESILARNVPFHVVRQGLVRTGKLHFPSKQIAFYIGFSGWWTIGGSMLRDIKQLQNAPAFGVTAIEGLLTVEGMLQEALRFVPYCDKHREVWSSHFARIILDAASQVDSVWKATAKLNDPATASDKLTLKGHFDRFGKLVAKQQAVFFGGATPCVINPFGCWQGPTFSAPTWWEAYNKLKHDRFSNQTVATLDHAVNAGAALLLAVIYCGTCDLPLLSAALVDSGCHNTWAFTPTGLLRDVTCQGHTKVETKLFAHPLGVFGDDNCTPSIHWDTSSIRFNIWWALNLRQFVKRP
jgi:hypothetical protein